MAKEEPVEEQVPKEQIVKELTLDDVGPIAEETEESLGSTEPDMFYPEFIFEYL